MLGGFKRPSAGIAAALPLGFYPFSCPSDGWAKERGIAWSDAVVSLVPLSLQNQR